MQRIDLNGDVGESFGAYTIGHDTALLRHVTSANVACGFHGGDPSVMRQTVRLAVAGGVALGAHPGFSDLQGFGRREITLSAQEVEDLVAYQIGALAGGGELIVPDEAVSTERAEKFGRHGVYDSDSRDWQACMLLADDLFPGYKE